MENGASHAQMFAAVPRHVAIIMDGNGRWAEQAGLPRVEGHRAGAKAVRGVVESARKLGVKYLTLFAFSTENWRRPEREVHALMALFAQYLASEVDTLLKNDIRLRAVGDLSRLPLEVRESLENSIERTKTATSLQLVLAISYGGRDEIARAARKIADAAVRGSLDVASIKEDTVSKYLDAPDIPDPDLLIRSSDEFRISNFLLWQLAYAEIVVSPMLWPDFSELEFVRCLKEYNGRSRRFGLTREQIELGEGSLAVSRALNQ